MAGHPEFAGLKTTKVIDGKSITGWFTEDFTLAQLKTLRAVERLPQVRPKNTAFNGLYTIPTLDEVLDLARHSRTCNGGQVGVYPETKHPTYFDSIGLSPEEPLLVDARGERDRTTTTRPSSRASRPPTSSSWTRRPTSRWSSCSTARVRRST